MASLIDRDRASLWHPYAPASATLPLWEVEAADGVALRLRDEEGGRHEVLDAMSSWWSVIHGYRHPVLDQAVKRQVDSFSHVMFGGLTHRPAVELAENLLDLVRGGALPGEGLERVFLADSGSIAVEVALKLAVQFQTAAGRPKRQRFLTIRGGYHGDTFAAMGVCDPVDGMHSAFPGMLAANVFAPRPPAAATATAEDVDSWRESVAALATMYADQLAGVIVEPVLQGAGGMFIYPPECLRILRDIANQHGLLLILDEIATGFGRTGELFAADHAGVTADILCVGKALTGGYLTLAATLCTGEVARTVSRHGAGALLHGPTFMANPLACGVANASLGLLRDGGWPSDVQRVGSGLAAGLAPALAFDGVRDVRTIGAVGVIELRDAVDVESVTREAIAHGVWIRPFRNLIYAMPPYVSSIHQTGAIAAGMVAAAAVASDRRAA
ncbi:adenosylmethionine--8-amino-7-oxononanoate transaminase [Paenarthrobacter ureafaciens]|uniref:adenosylmethionine--8-amino-7-oxononanoate transaminase n=1 Tax=Paenarthrobacter ureafaciens TaxID=37931 RepID=UPI001FB20D26|nr:adenosylmethionine--8-amino-7-oxononanoate transaminase [Paenarthrobacter ureafaciens]UOD83163.1 adenosylmethionine--8-amino-7-oxononanoate transaminase [Paenarthrobacter ureafaciens]WNZ05977.1 adenosylmethionine--8-amino-7-oxononanoate transaminase [Paenarthrobacter ureafaciens]